jgi:uncharacterized protein (DUF2235 family)
LKRIVILCDGTWNRSDSETPTNVVRFAQIMNGKDALGIVQVPIYIQGVGTGRGPTKMSRKLDSWLGGGLGWGLMANIEEAYRHLVFLWEPEDEIYILGFSRGAYTARSLTGFIRSTGIVDRDELHRIPEALERYRTLGDKRTHPNSDDSHAFRSQLSPRVVTSLKETAWRDGQGLPKTPILQIKYLGVWDSVGALGVPTHVPVLGRWTSKRYRFHDADLSSMVRSARHAVALDEQRKTFTPTRWNNVSELNEGRSKEDGSPYQELFFAGDHGSVGGGGDVTALSSIGLEWMVKGAEAAGLEFNAKRMQDIRGEQDAMGPLRNTTTPSTGILNWFMHRHPTDRKGPSSIEEVHPSALSRWQSEGKSSSFRPYRPGSLAMVHESLMHYHEKTMFAEDIKSEADTVSRA